MTGRKRTAALAALAVSAIALAACGGGNKLVVTQPSVSGIQAATKHAGQKLGFPSVATKNTTRVGGGDPIATLRKFPHRARSVHLKDFGGPSPESVIGEGVADWPTIFRLCETEQDTEWYVVEEGSADGTGFEIPRRSREALRRMGK